MEENEANSRTKAALKINKRGRDTSIYTFTASSSPRSFEAQGLSPRASQGNLFHNIFASLRSFSQDCVKAKNFFSLSR